jgi:hypothetical protein
LIKSVGVANLYSPHCMLPASGSRLCSVLNVLSTIDPSTYITNDSQKHPINAVFFS